MDLYLELLCYFKIVVTAAATTATAVCVILVSVFFEATMCHTVLLVYYTNLLGLRKLTIS